MSLLRQTDIVLQIIERLEQPDLRDLTRQPLIHEAVRLSIVYHHNRAPASIATLTRGHGAACQLHLLYDKIPRPAQLDFKVPLERYTELLMAMRRARFDSLDDAENISLLEADLWMVERAAGSFYHNLVLSPSTATGHHRELILAFRQHLPESTREGA